MEHVCRYSVKVSPAINSGNTGINGIPSLGLKKKASDRNSIGIPLEKPTKFTMAFADGTQSIRFHIQWVKNCQTVFEGMSITTGTGQVDMVKHLCNGPIRTTFTKSVESQHQNARIERARAAGAAVTRIATETQAEFERRCRTAHDTDLAAALDDATTNMVWIGLVALASVAVSHPDEEPLRNEMRSEMDARCC
jgi:hypothetical protein